MIKAFSCLWPQISLIFKDAFSLHDATSAKVERRSVCIYNFTGVAETSTAGLENNFSAFFLMDYLAPDLRAERFLVLWDKDRFSFFLAICISLFYPRLDVEYSMQ